RARALAAPLCLAVLDIDYFKNVNDAYGHVTGDRVLARIGAIAGDALRRTDFVARYGGEEFVVLMPDTEPAEAKSVLERLREEIERSHVLAPNGTPVRVTASVGVAALEDTDSPEQLLERADRALYRAKSRGRNRLESGAAHPTRP
ncbi:MAG: GGDEF domain-containing protein, partial [Myxococcota bacterium]